MPEEFIEAAQDVSKAEIVDSDEEQGGKMEVGEGPLGVDVGTCRIVISQKKGRMVATRSQLNAFFSVPYFKFTQDILEKNQVKYFVNGNSLVIIGDGAEKLSVIFNAEIRRPMQEGLLNALEVEGQKVIQKILENLIERPETLGESVCISLPAVPAGWEARLLYHEAILKNYFMSLGYRVKTITEGLAVILTELAENYFSGIGISFGGGMCNVCFSYMSIPVLSFSIPKAGDYIDRSVASVMNMLPTEVKLVKENELDFSSGPRNRVQNALQIFYDDVIYSVLSALNKEFSRSAKLPQLHDPIPIVLAGGTAMPKGFLSRFEKILAEFSFPIPVSGVRLANDPLTATVRGALIAAMSEETPFDAVT